MEKLLKNISFKEQDKQLTELFSTKAEKIATMLDEKNNKTGISTTQFRKFYEKVLELNEKASGLEDGDFDIKIKPFVKMINSKVQYSHTRKIAGNNFVSLMDISIKAVNSKEELQNFKYFLESIIGFMPKK